MLTADGPAGSSAAETPWLKRRPAQRSCSSRLVFFPFAGGAASALDKLAISSLPAVEFIAVQYPGREDRWREPGSPSFTKLVEEIAEALASRLNDRSAFWGHSFGALAAFETARTLRRRGCPVPARLFLSGARAPHLPPRDCIHRLNDKTFLDRVRAFGGIPDEVLKEASLMQAFLPVIRHDFRIFEEHRFAPEEPLPIPLSVFGGLSDLDVPIADILAWSVHTNRSFRSRFFEGDHFFLFNSQSKIVNYIVEDLEAAAVNSNGSSRLGGMTGGAP
jgi:surfactin synthase thioesterase subunit